MEAWSKSCHFLQKSYTYIFIIVSYISCVVIPGTKKNIPYVVWSLGLLLEGFCCPKIKEQTGSRYMYIYIYRSKKVVVILTLTFKIPTLEPMSGVFWVKRARHGQAKPLTSTKATYRELSFWEMMQLRMPLVLSIYLHVWYIYIYVHNIYIYIETSCSMHFNLPRDKFILNNSWPQTYLSYGFQPNSSPFWWENASHIFGLFANYCTTMSFFSGCIFSKDIYI